LFEFEAAGFSAAVNSRPPGNVCMAHLIMPHLDELFVSAALERPTHAPSVMQAVGHLLGRSLGIGEAKD
jgi:hypothetical protein